MATGLKLDCNLHNVLASSKLNFGECWGGACGLGMPTTVGGLQPVVVPQGGTVGARRAVNGLRPAGKTQRAQRIRRESQLFHYAPFKYLFSDRSERSERSKKRVKRAV